LIPRKHRPRSIQARAAQFLCRVMTASEFDSAHPAARSVWSSHLWAKDELMAGSLLPFILYNIFYRQYSPRVLLASVVFPTSHFGMGGPLAEIA
jgi:hypothetical protein